MGKIRTVLSSETPPDLVLKRHCGECQFENRCRQNAVEKDDLSLLAGMSEKERKKYHSKGIFTVTQLSYTFRPRRRPKRLRDKRERYHHSLKALAIRQNKVHVVGTPKIDIEGTQVYLDVEGLPDSDFYYLIGMRIKSGGQVIQHSLWADNREDEKSNWRKFLILLDGIERPIIICFGSYETTFIKTMCTRYGGPCQGVTAEKAISAVMNLLSSIYGHVYFPVPSNGLKEIAGFYGFRWSEAHASGLHSIVWRNRWEEFTTTSDRAKLICYNSEDCAALELITQQILSMQPPKNGVEGAKENSIVDVSTLERDNAYGFKRTNFVLPDLHDINRSAYWDYQRERVYVRSSDALRRSSKRHGDQAKSCPINRIVHCQRPKSCPVCGSERLHARNSETRTIVDLKVTRGGLKRWITEYRFKRFECQACHSTFRFGKDLFTRNKYGNGLMAFALYQCIELRLPVMTVNRSLNKIFGLGLADYSTNHFKEYAARSYAPTYDALLSALCKGKLLHVDETKISVGGRNWIVWVFASMEAVVYTCTETRKSDYVQSLLKDFKGVLVSDFFAGYDGMNCPQQKCLVHLIRDINDALYQNPYDDGLKRVAEGFTKLLKAVIQTVDLHGLKTYYLKKHLSSVDSFYKELSNLQLASEGANKLRDRLQKNRNVMFTFLQYDDVPWNNNNAEHAVKPFAMLRYTIKGVTTERGLQDYLVLLSICVTCQYKGVEFLEFLRSGEKDIDTFAVNHGKTRQKRSHVPRKWAWTTG